MKKIKQYFADVSKIIGELNKFESEILKIKNVILKANKLEKKIFIIGNGGSAGRF